MVLDWTKFSLLGIGIATIIPFWQQVRGFLTKVFRIFLKQRIIYDVEVQNFFYKELYDNSFIVNFDDYDLQNQTIFSTKDGKYMAGFFKIYKLEIFFYKNYIPLFISGHNSGLKIVYLKYTFNFDELFNKILRRYYDFYKEELSKKENQSRFYIEEIRGKSLKLARILEGSGGTTSGSMDKSTQTDSSKSNNFSHTIYPNGIKYHKLGDRIFGFDINEIDWASPMNQEKNKYIFTEKGSYVLNQVKKWLMAENFYQDRNIAYRRGILLNGHTGSGKSSLVLEIAKKLGIPIFVFDLSTFDNEEFCEKLKSLSSYPAIILFEDIDNQFDGRKCLSSTNNFQGLTFDCFINQLSGVKSIKNKFIFITTNHLNKIDSALSRGGRIDEIIDLPFLNKEERIKMASIILEDNEKLVYELVNNNLECNTAEFENICTRKALELYWNK